MLDQIIQIRTKGYADVEWARADFTATTTTNGRTGPEAKEKARPSILAIERTIAQFAERAGVDTTRVKTSFSVDVKLDYRNNIRYMDGYFAEFTANFSATNVEEATVLHDALTSLEGVAAPTPKFVQDLTPEVRKVAFQDALSKAVRLMDDQSRSLSKWIDSNTSIQYKLLGWGFEHEERSSGKMLSVKKDAEGTVKLKAGKARFELGVCFNFQLSGAVVFIPQEEDKTTPLKPEVE